MFYPSALLRILLCIMSSEHNIILFCKTYSYFSWDYGTHLYADLFPTLKLKSPQLLFGSKNFDPHYLSILKGLKLLKMLALLGKYCYHWILLDFHALLRKNDQLSIQSYFQNVKWPNLLSLWKSGFFGGNSIFYSD